MPTSDEPGPRRHGVAASFGYAFAGLAAAWRTQPNLRIHLVLARRSSRPACCCACERSAGAIVALAIGLVVAAELFNTALEAVVDLASPQAHPLAKLAKDVAAAGVLVAALAAAAAGVAVLGGALGR